MGPLGRSAPCPPAREIPAGSPTFATVSPASFWEGTGGSLMQEGPIESGGSAR